MLRATGHARIVLVKGGARDQKRDHNNITCNMGTRATHVSRCDPFQKKLPGCAAPLYVSLRSDGDPRQKKQPRRHASRGGHPGELPLCGSRA